MSVWLPAMAAAEITSVAVERFLVAGHPESSTVEYKTPGETKRIPEVVSALANTFGGVVIVGVPDDWAGDLDALVNVSITAEDRIVDALVDTLEPPWLPDFVSVEVSGRRLLVLVVEAGTAPRPLLAGGRGYVKRERRKAVAGWLELQALFAAERRPRAAVPSIHARQLTTAADLGMGMQLLRTPPEAGWRAVAGVPAWTHDLFDRVADAPYRDALVATLSASQLSEWMQASAVKLDLERPTAWADSSPSGVCLASFTSVATDRRDRHLEPRLAAHVQVEHAATPSAVGGGGIVASITIATWPHALAADRSLAATGAVQQGRLDTYLPSLTLDDIGILLEMFIKSLEALLLAAAGVLLETPPPGPPIGPVVSAVGELDALWNLGDARRATVNGLGSQRLFQQPPNFPLTDEDRHATVNRWLRVMLLSAGYVVGPTAWPT